MGRVVISLIVFTAIFVIVADAACEIDKAYQKTLYARQGGKRAKLYLTETNEAVYYVEASMTTEDKPWPTDAEMELNLKGTCSLLVAKDNKMDKSVNNTIYSFYNKTMDCYFCFQLFLRSPNVIEYRRTQCSKLISLTTTKEEQQKLLCGSIDGTTMVTGFADSDIYVPYNCKNLFEGIYRFTYELKDSYGVCSNRNNMIRACQAVGTQLRDNIIFDKTRGWCPGLVGTAAGTVKSGTVKEKWRCYGVWTDPNGHIKAAIQQDTVVTKFRYRCMITTIDQQPVDNARRWGMTTSADCAGLVDDYEGAAYRLQLKPSLDDETQLPFLQPSCNLPKEFVGKWFFPGPYNTDVTINSTHIMYKRMKSEFEYEIVYFSCRQAQENRYLMATVAQGKCEMDFMCFHFLPRHHNILRFRSSRPYRFQPSQNNGDYMVRMFRQACAWTSFTLMNQNWVYQYYILNPPVPVNCPIQGRFRFVQHGDESERYVTKIPGGVTLRPRIQVKCEYRLMESDLAICVTNTREMKLDVERCMALDHTGRPYSEYDIWDNALTCVGFWMEDARSYLITYDPDDPVTKNFRCWVYKRIGFNDYLMSRAAGGHCDSKQKAESNSTDEGVSLLLELTANERQFDGCPMKFDDGLNPYGAISVLEIFSAAPMVTSPSINLILVITIVHILFQFRRHITSCLL